MARIGIIAKSQKVIGVGEVEVVHGGGYSGLDAYRNRHGCKQFRGRELQAFRRTHS